MSDDANPATTAAAAADASNDLARRRFFTIQAARLAGVALLLVAILAVHAHIVLPPVAGYVLAPVGLVLFAAVPVVLARRWRSPRA